MHNKPISLPPSPIPPHPSSPFPPSKPFMYFMVFSPPELPTMKYMKHMKPPGGCLGSSHSVPVVRAGRETGGAQIKDWGGLLGACFQNLFMYSMVFLPERRAVSEIAWLHTGWVGRRVPSPPCAWMAFGNATEKPSCHIPPVRRAGDCPPYPQVAT